MLTLLLLAYAYTTKTSEQLVGTGTVVVEFTLFDACATTTSPGAVFVDGATKLTVSNSLFMQCVSTGTVTFESYAYTSSCICSVSTPTTLKQSCFLSGSNYAVLTGSSTSTAVNVDQCTSMNNGEGSFFCHTCSPSFTNINCTEHAGYGMVLSYGPIATYAAYCRILTCSDTRTNQFESENGNSARINCVDFVNCSSSSQYLISVYRAPIVLSGCTFYNCTSPTIWHYSGKGSVTFSGCSSDITLRYSDGSAFNSGYTLTSSPVTNSVDSNHCYIATETFTSARQFFGPPAYALLFSLAFH